MSCSSLIYIPCSSLDDEDIQSLVRLIRNENVDRVDKHGGRKVALKYLLLMHQMNFDLSKWIETNEWKSLQDKFDYLKQFDFYKEDFDLNNKVEEYWELKSDSKKIHSIAKQSRRFHLRENPFSPQQLKIYFNHHQIVNLPFSSGTFQSSGFVDENEKENLLQYPIIQRQNPGLISLKQGRIEQIIFDVPPDKQIIILDFADERMPGGLFLHGANTQEETICTHSETYRALLDLKYQRFPGGFFIPEFGCLYLKNLRFSRPPQYNEHRQIDVIAAACYDLTGEHGLHQTPHDLKSIEENTRKKFQTIISAAQANSNSNGRETFLLLGPIGCGAFQNDLHMISQLWKDVLSQPLNEQFQTQQRHAFQQIWFISGAQQKLNVFQQIILSDQHERL